MTRSRTVLIALVAAASVAVGLFCCGGTTQREAEPTGSPVTPPSTRGSAVAPATTAALATSTPGTSGPSGMPSASPNDAGADSSPTPDGGSRSGSAIVNAVSTTDPHDLSLYSSIERELHREPPAEVRAIVRRRTEGASREELTKLARELPDLQLRVLVLRWVDRVFSTPKPTPSVPGGSASGRPFVKPIAPAH